MTSTDVRRVSVAPPPRPAGNTTIWRALLIFLPLGAGVLVYLRHGLAFVGVDFDVYHGGAVTLLNGEPLYEFVSANQLPFTYPPFAALTFTPLALFTAALAAAGWTLLSVAAMEAVIWLVLGRLDVTDRAARLRWTAIAGVLMLPLGPVGFNLWAGQINIILLLLVFLDLVGRTGRFRGVAIGIAAGIKLTPLIFIPYLLFTRRFRAAATATATFAGTVLAGFLLLPKDAVQYWFSYMTDVHRVTGDDVPFLNSSIRGLLGRLDVPHLDATYFVLAAVVGVVGLALSIRLSRRGHELAGIMACGIVSLLISPVSWLFHWVWIVPLLTMWTARAWRGDLTAEKVGVVAVWAAGVGSFYWMILLFLHVPVPVPVTQVFANLHLVIGVSALVAFAVSLRREAERRTWVP